MSSTNSKPRSVLMDDELWGDLADAASDRQKRLRQPTSVSDIVREGARLLAAEERDAPESASRRIAADIMAVLADDDPQREEELRGMVRRVLLGDIDAEDAG